jgi:phosphoribosylglycinamide formyltransferase 1
MFRIVVLASGSGTNFQAIHEAIARGELSATITGVLCNNPNAGVLERARGLDIPTQVFPSKGIVGAAEREAYDATLGDAADAWGADLLVLAGYMRLLTAPFVRRFALRMVNIHPSLLPAFPGLQVHEAVLNYGCKLSGCTVHYVDEGLDSGPIIAQACVPVLSNDDPATLAARVRVLEHQVYPWAIEQIARGRVQVEGRRVLLESEPPSFCVP